MTKIKIGEKEYKIYFGYAATVKSGIIRKLVNLEKSKDDMESVDDILLFLPELLLVGLQKFHSDEFGFNMNDPKDKEAKMAEAFDLLDTYFEMKESDIQTLYSTIQNELIENGFLAGMFRKEQKAAAESEKRAKEKAEAQN